jgi:hypothetical protein
MVRPRVVLNLSTGVGGLGRQRTPPGPCTAEDCRLPLHAAADVRKRQVVDRRRRERRRRRRRLLLRAAAGVCRQEAPAARHQRPEKESREDRGKESGDTEPAGI